MASASTSSRNGSAVMIHYVKDVMVNYLKTVFGLAEELKIVAYSNITGPIFGSSL